MSPIPAPAGGPRSRRLARTIVAALGWVLVAGFAYLVWPSWLGGHTTIITVSGHSMEPLYHSGDIVIARTAAPHVGDIVVYRPEGYPDAKIVHRIIGGDGVSGWQMRGDNNTFTDPFTPTNDAVYGVAKAHIPHAGVVLSFLSRPWVWISLLIGMAALLLWPDKDDGDNDDSQPGGPSRQHGSVYDDSPTQLEGAVLASIVAVAGLVRAVSRRRTRGLAHAMSALAVIALLAPLLVAALHMASASALTISATGVTPSAAAYCWSTSTSLTVATAGTASGGSFTQLTVSGIPSACAGKAMTVSVRSNTGAVLATGTATAATGDTTVTTSSYAGASLSYAVVTIGAPRGAKATAPAVPATCVPTDVNGNTVAGTCTVTNVTITDSWGTPGSRSANATFTATSSSGWFKITFDFSQAPFPGWYPHSITGNIGSPTSSCSALPLVTVAGPNWSNSQSPSYAYYFQFSEAGGNICS